MKTISFLRTNAMLVVALLTAGITMSFQMAEKEVVDTIYTYNSSSTVEGEFAKSSNWIMVVQTPPTCDVSGNRPCNITVPAGLTLDSQISDLSNSQVLAIHPDERKP